jgi:tRNA modification GTPase
MHQDKTLTDHGHTKRANDTVVALSTARGVGAVAVVRLSGPDSWAIARKMVAERKFFGALSPRSMALFDLIDGSGERIDRALAVKFEGPASYTGEHIVEFHCHGGLAVSSAVIDSATLHGARLATAGEFTRRAFLNGRLDLAQAEAVDNLIHARTDEGLRTALAGLDGSLGRQVEAMRSSLLEFRTELEYRIDFPDEAGQDFSPAQIQPLLDDSLKKLDSLLQGAGRALLACRGAVAVIAGAPNVGKSSLFNSLLGSSRAIVTSAPGTTRDAVESELVLEGHLVRLVDTAGLRTSIDEAERIGVEYSRHYIASSDVVLFVHEAGSDFRRAESEFLAAHGRDRLVRVLSKVDLHPIPDGETGDFIPVSSKTGEGLERLKSAIASAVDSAAGSSGGKSSQVTSLRQKKLLEEARELLGTLNLANPPEIIAADIDHVCTRLAEITGLIATEDVLDSIFSRFCIGK